MIINKTKYRKKNKYKPFSILLRISAAFLLSVLFLIDSALSKQSSHNDTFHQTSPFSFALIGDLPYDVKLNEKSNAFTHLIDQINEDNNIEWVLHVGDIKTGMSSCTERFLRDRKRRFSKFDAPFILTPGDNKWTDCHRMAAGNFDPLDRLEKLREIFYTEENKELQSSVPSLTIQSDIQESNNTSIENFYWQKNNVAFATIHIVGSFNGEKDFKGRGAAHDEEIVKRNRAALDWLQYAFEKSKRDNNSAIFIAIHANPGFDVDSNNLEEKENHKKAYGEFIKKLFKLSGNFKKPVVLSHGDSHTFRIDQPNFFEKAAPINLFRVETFGETNNSWIKVTVDPNSPGVFSFSPIRN